jgi:hypothetical protein
MFRYENFPPFPKPPATESEMLAHKQGLQSFYRQFQPSFSPDPYVVEEFNRPMPFLQGVPPWSPEKLAQDVRGPLARFAPGGSSFQLYFGNNVRPPVRAFTYDEVTGKPVPFRYGNQWSSFRSQLPPIFGA